MTFQPAEVWQIPSEEASIWRLFPDARPVQRGISLLLSICIVSVLGVLALRRLEPPRPVHNQSIALFAVEPPGAEATGASTSDKAVIPRRISHAQSAVASLKSEWVRTSIPIAGGGSGEGALAGGSGNAYDPYAGAGPLQETVSAGKSVPKGTIIRLGDIPTLLRNAFPDIQGKATLSLRLSDSGLILRVGLVASSFHPRDSRSLKNFLTGLVVEGESQNISFDLIL